MQQDLTPFPQWITRIRAWLDNDSLSDEIITSFLTAATARLNNELESPVMETIYPISMTPSWWDPESYVIPDDFGRVINLSVPGVGQYVVTTAGELAERKARNDQSQRVFAINFGNGTVDVFPNFPVNSEAKLCYYRSEAPLSETYFVNAYSRNFPNLLRFAALVEGASYLVDSEMTQIYEARYARELAAVNLAGKRSKFGATPLQRIVKVM